MLKIADKNMKFGFNKNVNYYASSNSSDTKKIHQDQALTHHLENLESLENESTGKKRKNDIIDKRKEDRKKQQAQH